MREEAVDLLAVVLVVGAAFAGLTGQWPLATCLLMVCVIALEFDR